jgi:hypothetical protein
MNCLMYSRPVLSSSRWVRQACKPASSWSFAYASVVAPSPPKLGLNPPGAARGFLLEIE